MIEPNNISHSIPLTHYARGYKLTTSLHSTPKSREDDVITSCVPFCTLLTHSTMNSASSSYQFVGKSSTGEAPTAASFAPSQAVVVGAAGAREELAKTLSYDPVSGELRWLVSNARKKRVAGGIAGNVRSDGYRVIYIQLPGLKFRYYPAHCLAWLYVTGEWPKLEIDHRDGNRLNNAIANLREATKSQNQANSKHRGYSVVKQGSSVKYRARIEIDDREIHLGYFDSAAEAQRAYRTAHIKAFGEFSFLNRLGDAAC